MTVVALPVALILPLPATGSWPYIAGSAVFQLVYGLLLVAAYRHGELSQVYPIIRGSAPLLVTAAGLAFAGEVLHPFTMLGVMAIVIGIMLLSLGKTRAAGSSILYAVATGVAIAGYSTVDAIGIRLSGDRAAYISWAFVLPGFLLAAASCSCADVAHRSEGAGNLEGGRRRHGIADVLRRGADRLFHGAGRAGLGPARDERRLRRPHRLALPWRDADGKENCRLHRRRFRGNPHRPVLIERLIFSPGLLQSFLSIRH